MIAIVGNPNSFLAREADFVLDCRIEKEACPNNLAPTCSSTAQLVMGDALASCLIVRRGLLPKISQNITRAAFWAKGCIPK